MEKRLTIVTSLNGPWKEEQVHKLSDELKIHVDTHPNHPCAVVAHRSLTCEEIAKALGTTLFDLWVV